MTVLGQTVATFETFDLTKYSKSKYHIYSNTTIFSKIKIIFHLVSLNHYQKKPNNTAYA